MGNNKRNLETFVNPYWMYKDEPYYLARYIDEHGTKILCGWVNQECSFVVTPGIIEQCKGGVYKHV